MRTGGSNTAAAAPGGIARQLPVRPRSPEGKAGATRARSPLIGAGGSGSPTGAVANSRPGGGTAPSRIPVPGGSATNASGPSVGSPLPAALARVGVNNANLQQAQQQSRRQSSTTVEEIKRIDHNREQRRKAAEEVRRNRQEEAALLSAQCGGVVPDIDFHRMIRDFRQQCQQATALNPMDPNAQDSIIVCARKRPIQPFETQNRELDCVTACNPYAIVHERKFKVDGITKCLESHQFEFDCVFDETATTEDVYRTVTQPLVPWTIQQGGRATLFAYGQTGSGKTHTMTGIQRQLVDQVFEDVRTCKENLEVSCSFFEIYGGRPYDLLNGRQRLETLEDARNEVQIAGLTERAANAPDDLLQCIELGNSLRTTHATAINRDSSRSHAVCSVFLRQANGGSIHGKITLVDLAGSERAADSKSSIRQRRVEGAQINKSLLALKECIRAMGNSREAHVPFRASKLTLVLRDAFVSTRPSKTVMIACISPGMMSADHSVNTLRYSDRLKDHPKAIRASSAPRGAQDAEDGDRGGRPRSINRPPANAGPSAENRAPSRRRSPSPAQAPPEAAQPRSAWPRHPSPSETPKEVPQTPAALDHPVSEEDDDPVHVDEAFDPVEECVGGGTSINSETVQSESRGSPTGSRPQQQLPRRGRQPTLRPPASGVPNRPDALGSRGRQPDAPSGARSAAPATSAQESSSAGHSATATSNSVASATATSASLASATSSANATASTGGSTTIRSPRLGRDRSPDPPSAAASRAAEQDNRYLHNTLTSEVIERERGNETSAVVDVGVEDLNDIAHMEALDEVRQWEDRIVSQHMVALQEDARLLTLESELLSQVQQTTNYDIDSYVGQVEDVVRRKMKVYKDFLEELEAFKAQLRREESLSRSCQRARVDGGPVEAIAREQPPVETQRTPRTPRT